jgi:hypothetical protein
MKVEVIGTVKEVQDVMTFDSGFQKQTVIIETEDKFNNQIPVQMIKENVGSFERIPVGTQVRLDAYVGGREYNGRYYVDITLSKITGVNRGQEQHDAQRAAAEAQVYKAAVGAAQPTGQAKQLHAEIDKGDELPF